MTSAVERPRSLPFSSRILLRGARLASEYSLAAGLRLAHAGISMAARLRPGAPLPLPYELDKHTARFLLGCEQDEAPDPARMLELNRRHAWIQQAKLCAIRAENRGGLPALQKLIELRHAERLLSRRAAGKSVILVSSHLMSLYTWTNPALDMLSVPIIKIVIGGAEAWTANRWTVLRWDCQPGTGAPHLKSALKALRTGASALLIPDLATPVPSAREHNLRGRRFRVLPGFATLALLADADVLPISAYWNRQRTRVIVEIDEPLPKHLGANGPEDSLALGFVRYVDNFLQRHPDQTRFGYVHLLPEAEARLNANP